ncbi:MAG: ABC transporter permease subunit [Myxococcota bacterium]
MNQLTGKEGGSAVGGAQGRSRRRLLTDRLARLVVTAGGVGIIASILGILVFLVVEVWPLVRPAEVERGPEVSTLDLRPAALLVDPYRTNAITLALDGAVRVYNLASGELRASSHLGGTAPPASPPEDERRADLLAVSAHSGDGLLAAASAGGEVFIQPVSFRVHFEDRTRRVTPELDPVLRLVLDPEGGPLRRFAARGAEGRLQVAAELADGSIGLVARREQENPFSGETEATTLHRVLPGVASLRHLVLDGAGQNLFGATETGDLVWWRLGSPAPTPEIRAASASAITSLDFLIGERALVVGSEDGSLSVWALVRPQRGEPQLTRIHQLPSHETSVVRIATSERNRTFLSQDAGGELRLYFSTTEELLWSGEAPLRGVSAATFAPKGDAIYLAGEGRIAELRVDNPHPETTLASLFSPVWYEGAPEPKAVWQSSGGTDDFEPKLSLTPLLVGTLKGTLFSLALAIPLGVLGAMYTSQFMHPRLQRIVKPSVEIMASLPSVVLGFLAGLWLAPRLEGAFPGLILALCAFPLLTLLAGLLFQALPRRVRARLADGVEVFWFAAVIAIGLAGCFALSGLVEEMFFGGSFAEWLLESTGTRYDQRNAVVIGIAMGFAVIPIVFAISEDAFSNVPRSLAAASRALGANAWQTVVRVILPTASPGIFSAIMIGFGRAVGETMIVLMATGNTPILDWSPFNGFRTLSANVAVEIPEAPVGGTLYRTLFVAALLLFAITFLVNTLAEVIRHRLRRRFAGL